MSKVIQIGVGHWGVNHKRILSELGVLVETCDINGQEDTTIYDGRTYFDHAVVCTPPNTHYDIVKELLLLRRHVFVEKPLAETADECRELYS